MKNLILAIVILLVGFTAEAQNADPDLKSRVIELVNIQLGHNILMEDILGNLEFQITEEKKVELKKDLMTALDKLIYDTADKYIEIFNKEEIEAMLEFYNSPIGQQIQIKMPEVLKTSSILQQEFAMELMPIFQKYMN